MTEPHPNSSDGDQPASEVPATTRALRLAALALLLIGCFTVLRPFLSALMWAIVLCLAGWPVYGRLVRVLGGRRSAAALVMALSTVLIMLAPFVLIGISLADDVRDVTNGIQHFLAAPPPDPPAWVRDLPVVGSYATEAWQRATADSAVLRVQLRRFAEPVTTWLLSASGRFVAGLAELALSILLAFFLFRDGQAAAQRLLEAGEQLVGERARQLADLSAKTVRGVVYGILGTALAQSVIAGIGFVIAGVPRPGFLALVTFFLSVTPVGAPLVWIPAAIWLFSEGFVGWGVFMICWGLLVSSVDNVVKPMIIRYGSRMPFILILLGVLGGAIAFGLIGVFLGPTLLAVGLRSLEEWNVGRTQPAGGGRAPSSSVGGEAGAKPPGPVVARNSCPDESASR